MHVFIKVRTPITRKLGVSPKIDINKSVLELNFTYDRKKNSTWSPLSNDLPFLLTLQTYEHLLLLKIL